MLFLFITLCSMFDWTTAADGMFPLKSLNIIATNPDCKINPCNRCEGNCAGDDDCAGNLKCWKRSYSHSTVPGCATGGEANKNYCYEPCPDGALPVNGCKNTFFSFDFTPTKALISGKTCNNGNCGECEGNCDNDSDCAANLKCWKRDHPHSNVPGCATGGEANENYCYKPCPNDGTKAVPYVHGCRSNLRTVLRETAGCSVTDGTIDVWVNGATGANEVYDIISSSDMRLGGQLIMGTNNIVDVGSLQAADITTGTLYVTDLSGTGVVDENNIKNGAVTTTAIRSNAVTSATIKNGAVTEAKIGTNAVSSAKIKNGAVAEAKIGTNAVSSAKIKNGAVTSAKIATNAVGNGEINNGASFTMNYLTVSESLTVADSITAADGAFVVADQGGGGRIYDWAKVTLKGHLRVQDSPTESQLGIGGEMGYQVYFKNSNWNHPSWSTNWGSDPISIWCPNGAIHSQTYIGASDRRIKKDIRPLKDHESLEILRQLDTVAYKYKDVVKRGPREVIGFIAQDVNKTIPAAVTVHKDYIPNELREIEIDWEYVGTGYAMRLSKETLSTGRYQIVMFTEDKADTYYLNTVDGKTFLTEDGDNFLAKKKYNPTALLYGKEVDDFMSIDKQKIFAVAYSALQQVDKNQIVLQQKVASLEETIAKLSERLAALDGQS